jgi:hypothetical protein
LATTVERVAAAQFTREAIGEKSNELFIALLGRGGGLAEERSVAAGRLLVETRPGC